MSHPKRVEDAAITTWLSAHAGWAREGDAITRTFKFPDFSSALAFVVQLGLVAEKNDHHPDLALSWGKVTVSLTTHDANGITEARFSISGCGGNSWPLNL